MELDRVELDNIARHCELLASLGLTESVILDVGANAGEATAEYLARMPQCSAHVVEPNPVMAARLQTRFEASEARDRVRVHSIALGVDVGTADLHVFADDAVSSLLPIDHRVAALSTNFNSETSVSVEVRTLDWLCDPQRSDSVPRPDFIKVDTQGYDLHVLKGGRSLLDGHPPALVQVEMVVAAIYVGQPSFHEIWGLMSGLGYKLYDFEKLVHTSKGNLYFGDALFVSAQAWDALNLL